MRTENRELRLAFALTMVMLTACGGNQAIATGDVASATSTGHAVDASPEAASPVEGHATATSGVVSAVDTREELDADYEGALDVGAQLALGTLLLEETVQPLTAERAGQLLPLWQALQGDVTAGAEVDAVLAEIETAMTSEQVAAIASMALTQEDVQVWMQEQGQAFGAPGGSGEPAGERPKGEGERAGMGTMSEEDREAMLATRQAGGGMPSGGVGAAGGTGQYQMLLRPLITLLEARAGEA